MLLVVCRLLTALKGMLKCGQTVAVVDICSLGMEVHTC